MARPRSVEALQALVARAASTGTALAPRGGGMSYTRGYVADRPDLVVVDLRALDAIERVDAGNHVAVVQPGVTWAQLRAQLAPLRLRARFWGPLSGLQATVGGGISQNAAFWGTGRYGTAAADVETVAPNQGFSAANWAKAGSRLSMPPPLSLAAMIRA